jgi:hypothetical protein
LTEWQPIESCPKDETWFLALIEGIPYKCKALLNNGVVNYLWCMHTNMATGQTLRIHGNGLREQIQEAEEPRYEPKILAYKLGMNHIPTHWLPLPTAPQIEEK